MNNNNTVLMNNPRITLKVKQYDKSGKLVNVFKSRYQAAIWILENNLTDYFYESIGKTRSCIAGALTNAINKNQSKAYGYRWELLPPTNKSKITKDYPRVDNNLGLHRKGRKVKILDPKGKTLTLPSIKSASILLSTTSEALRYQLNKNKVVEVNKNIVNLQRKSPKKGTYMKELYFKPSIAVVAKNILTNQFVKFESLNKAADTYGIDRKTIKRSIEKQQPNKNIQWKLLISGNN